jgi:hypothetical protein
LEIQKHSVKGMDSDLVIEMEKDLHLEKDLERHLVMRMDLLMH